MEMVPRIIQSLGEYSEGGVGNFIELLNYCIYAGDAALYSLILAIVTKMLLILYL